MLLNIVDFLYALSLNIDNRRPNKLKFVPRNIIKYLVNFIVPIYYMYTRRFHHLKNEKNPEYIVSLTSFPARIKTLHIVIESLIRQSQKPDRIILWLSKEQFEGKEVLPPYLLEQENRGLEIRFVDDDLRPHKKYFYAMQEYPEANIITVDDDIFYPPYMIERLVKTHHKYPTCICCNRAVDFTFENDVLKSYLEWNPVDKKMATMPNFKILPTGVGGVLYPPNSLNKELLFNTDIIKKTCLNGDDLWLNLMARLKSTRTVICGKRIGFIPILSTMGVALSRDNIIHGNDKQISQLIQYFGKDVFLLNLI